MEYREFVSQLSLSLSLSLSPLSLLHTFPPFVCVIFCENLLLLLLFSLSLSLSTVSPPLRRVATKIEEMGKVDGDKKCDDVDNFKSAGFRIKKRKKNTKSALKRKMKREKKFANGARGVADLAGSKASRRAAEKKERQKQKRMERYVLVIIS